MPAMSDVEDYPGPSRQPAKQGQDPLERADEGMVKPPVNPVPKKDSPADRMFELAPEVREGESVPLFSCCKGCSRVQVFSAKRKIGRPFFG